MYKIFAFWKKIRKTVTSVGTGVNVIKKKLQLLLEIQNVIDKNGNMIWQTINIWLDHLSRE